MLLLVELLKVEHLAVSMVTHPVTYVSSISVTIVTMEIILINLRG